MKEPRSAFGRDGHRRGRAVTDGLFCGKRHLCTFSLHHSCERRSDVHHWGGCQPEGLLTGVSPGIFLGVVRKTCLAASVQVIPPGQRGTALTLVPEPCVSGMCPIGAQRVHSNSLAIQAALILKVRYRQIATIRKPPKIMTRSPMLNRPSRTWPARNGSRVFDVATLHIGLAG